MAGYFSYDSETGIGVYLDDKDIAEAGGGWFKYQCLYYDLNKDGEISFNKYLSNIGISYTNLWSWFTTTNEYKKRLR